MENCIFMNINKDCLLTGRAGCSMDEFGQLIPLGKKTTRFRLVEDHPAFDIAIVWISKEGLSFKNYEKVASGRYIRILDQNGDQLLLKVRSAASRLHLTSEQVHDLYQKGGLNALVRQGKALSYIFSTLNHNSSTREELISKIREACLTMKMVRDNGLALRTNWNDSTHVIMQSNKGYLDVFNVKERLGEGSFGQVDELVNVVTLKTIALKTLHPPVFNNNVDPFYVREKYRIALKDLFNEYHILELLHKNGKAIGIQDPPKRTFKLLKEENHERILSDAYITTKYASNYFRDIIKDDVTYRDRILECRQLLIGLAHMETCGVMHGDIKTENILIKTNKNGKRFIEIADFGGATTDIHERMDGKVCTDSCVANRDMNIEKELLYKIKERGKNKYIRDFKELQFKQDVFAMGLVFYELFSRLNSPYLFDGACVDVYSEYRELNTIPKDVGFMIKEMLHLNYNKRWTATETLSYIDKYINTTQDYDFDDEKEIKIYDFEE